MEEAGAQLEEIFDVLENHFRDMCDIEFTIEQGKLWMLQTRAGKRTAAAALRIAIEMEKEGLITKEEAVMRVAPDQLDQLLHPQFDKNATYDVVARGLNASPGAAVGEAVFSAADAVAAAEAGRKCVLVRWETNPDDLAGMIAAEGILHLPWRQDEPRGRHRPRHGRAVRVRRGGAEDRRRQEGGRHRRHRPGHPRGRHDLHRRHHGHRGPRRGGTGHARAHRRLGHHPGVGRRGSAPWACAPTPTTPRTPSSPATSAPRASAFAAPSTCSWAIASRSSRPSFCNDDELIREKAVADLFEAQVGDFYGMFKAMDGLPVIVRLLDPPLHEFLESPRELAVEIATMEATGAAPDAIAEKRDLLEKIDGFAEQNPMLGMRGCRLGIVYPDPPRDAGARHRHGLRSSTRRKASRRSPRS